MAWSGGRTEIGPPSRWILALSRLDRFYSPPEIGAPGKRRGRTMRRDLVLSSLFILVMLLVALAFIATILPHLRPSNYRLEADFLDARGLTQGTKVVQQGYVIGLVERVEPIFGLEDGEKSAHEGADGCRPVDGDPRLPVFRAELRIRNEWKIPVDSRAQLGSAGLLEDDVIKIRTGMSRSSLQPGDCILTLDREADLPEQVAVLTVKITRLTEQMTRLIDETVEPALKRIAKQIERLEILLGTGMDPPDASSGLAATFKSLRDYLEELKAAVDPGEIEHIIGSVRAGTGDLAHFSEFMNQKTAGIEKTLAHLQATAERLEIAIREDHPPIRQAIADSQYLLQELSVSIVPILTHIEETTRNLSELSHELRNDPRAFFRRREAEKPPSWFQAE